ncbi:MAG: hypothetical protein CfP315_0792 [Candidatus Improbicoccus pseudotrichonymphae]|uniref:Uncharacterized protein n=1 Tax=Candidatus Improbicoccus pseudotrichonymphae TaxID=3033792 RepID=A0AA48HVI4_9FIRM|nr:MAG: hypothetical protein CfP315_0792 [Candidatus Improbicoccus pseudotrichonymphae]
MQCYSNSLINGRKQEYSNSIDIAVQKENYKIEEIEEYVKNEYDKIIKNFKKVQDKVLPESCFEEIEEIFKEISNEDQKDFIANLGIIIIFLYLSSSSRGALGYKSRIINEGEGHVACFRIIATEAVKRLLRMISDGGLPEDYRGLKGDLKICLEELQESDRCSQVIFYNKLFPLISEKDCFCSIICDLVEKLPKDWIWSWQ